MNATRTSEGLKPYCVLRVGGGQGGVPRGHAGSEIQKGAEFRGPRAPPPHARGAGVSRTDDEGDEDDGTTGCLLGRRG
jgi:hypothetical protein